MKPLVLQHVPSHLGCTVTILQCEGNTCIAACMTAFFDAISPKSPRMYRVQIAK